MAAEAVAIIDPLDCLIARANALFEQVKNIQIDWNALQWNSEGPSGLFGQFRIAGGWADFIISKVLELEQERNLILSGFNDQKISLEKKYEKALKDGSKGWVLQGFAYQERAALARIEVGSGIWDQTVFDRKIEVLNSMITVLRAKAKQFTDFKGDARVAIQILNFGYSIGELK